MNRISRLLAIAVMLVATAVCAQAQYGEFDYDKAYDERCLYAEELPQLLTRFEGLRHDTSIMPQKWTMAMLDDGTYCLVISPFDEREMMIFTGHGESMRGRVVKDHSTFNEGSGWEAIASLGLYNKKTYNDITLSQRPLPITQCDKKKNRFISSIQFEDAPADVSRHTRMMFKPHVNTVKMLKNARDIKKDESGNVLHDKQNYTFALSDSKVIAKMFRGYGDYEMAPWVVTPEFLSTHNVLQFTRWKEGEKAVEASADCKQIIERYYNGRRVVKSRWLASCEVNERSFYAVQFAHEGTNALAAVVCLAEGEVVSTWEFAGDVDPQNPEQSIWFVDDEGDFIPHAPEIQCITASDAGLELYVRLFGGESVNYIVLREIGSVMVEIQYDTEITAW